MIAKLTIVDINNIYGGLGTCLCTTGARQSSSAVSDANACELMCCNTPRMMGVISTWLFTDNNMQSYGKCLISSDSDIGKSALATLLNGIMSGGGNSISRVDGYYQ